MYPLPSALEPAQGVGQETTDPAGSSLSAYSVCLVGFFFFFFSAEPPFGLPWSVFGPSGLPWLGCPSWSPSVALTLGGDTAEESQPQLSFLPPPPPPSVVS